MRRSRSGPLRKLVLYLTIGSTTLSAYASNFLHGTTIRWDTATNLTSPDGKWRIEVRGNPRLDKEGAPVLLEDVKTGRQEKVFDLDREASIIWGHGGTLLILNAPGAGHEQVLLIDPFKLYSASRSTTDKIDRRLKSVVENRIGRDKEVAFYIPRVESWKDNKLTLAIGGTAAPKESGSMMAYCYIFTIDTNRQKIERVLDESMDTNEASTKRCQIFP